MQYRCEFRAVINREFIQLTRSLRLGVALRIIAAYEPKHRRHLPCGAEAAEILAGRSRPRMFHPIGGKIAAKSRGDAVARGFVIDVEWVAVERRDLRFARSPRRFGLGI